MTDVWARLIFVIVQNQDYMESKMVKIDIYDKRTERAIKQDINDNGGYCPCQVEHTEDTKCMCKNFKDMDNGVCICKLFIKTTIE